MRIIYCLMKEGKIMAQGDKEFIEALLSYCDKRIYYMTREFY